MPNNLLTINMITREAVQLFQNSNVFLQNLSQYEELFAPQWTPLDPLVVKTAKLALVGSATEKAVESRRGLFSFFGRAAAVLAAPEEAAVAIAPRIGTQLRIRLPSDFHVRMENFRV